MHRRYPCRRWAALLAVTAVLALIVVLPSAGFGNAGADLWTERNSLILPPTTTVPAWVEIAKGVKPAVVSLTVTIASARDVPYGRGSGFIINPAGYVLTNSHVVDEAADVQVMLSDGREFTVLVVGTDPETDVALLKIDGAGHLPVVPLGDSSALQVGEPVMAVGNPFGLEQTVTTGIVSATERVIGQGVYDAFIQTDAAINPGNSGGPLVNAKGEVVGINTAILSRSGGSIGIGFAVPINVAKFVAPQLAEHGRVVRGWLGVTIEPVRADLAKTLGVTPAAGAFVSSVYDDSPAAKAGLKAGDIIVEYDGHKIRRAPDLSRAVTVTPVGKYVSITVLREGKPLTLSANIARLADRDDIASASEGSSRRTNLGWRFSL